VTTNTAMYVMEAWAIPSVIAQLLVCKNPAHCTTETYQAAQTKEF